MKVLVCGGRDYSNVDRMYQVLDSLFKYDEEGNADEFISTIISGHARGADQMGEMYAHERDIEVEVYPADWDKYGRRAGYLRNVQMAVEGKPDLIVAFPGGRGTAMMIGIGKERGIEVMEVRDDIRNSHT